MGDTQSERISKAIKELQDIRQRISQVENDLVNLKQPVPEVREFAQAMTRATRDPKPAEPVTADVPVTGFSGNS